MTTEEDILTNEVEFWKGFEYALRERIGLFSTKLSNKEQYAGCVNAKGKNFSL
jgi:hypothetical protein